MILLLVLAVILCACLFGFLRRDTGEKEIWDDGPLRLSNEAATVACDFLEAGRAVSLLTEGKYRGTISVRQTAREGEHFGYTVYMYDSGDLARAFDQYKQTHQSLFSRDPEALAELSHFIGRYGGFYDPDRDALAYPTEHTALKSQSAETEALLRQKLLRHPLAELEAISQIHTKGL